MRQTFRLCLALLCLAFTFSAAAKAPARHGAQPPLLLISIDGFRADYIHRGITPVLSALAAHGVLAKGMEPSFPSLTFPNHYTLVTGLYPDHHGIVDNSMYDPKLGRFTLGNRKAVGDGRWWREGEPIWVTADRAGLKTATLFWPGSEARIHGYRPDHWLRYDGAMPYARRVDRVLHWLDLPRPQRPDFLTLYFEGVDTAGHYDGPDSPQVNRAIRKVDAAIGRLVAGLKQRGLFRRMNLIVVADHGMASTPPSQRILLDRIIDTRRVRVVSTGAIAGIDPAPGYAATAAARLLAPHAHMRCWRKAQIPARFHYGHNPRVPAIVCSPKLGWLIVSDRTHLLHHGKPMRGDHGYDNALVPMRALFLAHGPAFRRGITVPVFPNVDVYPLMAHLLHIHPQHNDGDYRAVEDMLVRSTR